jgi:hypothetical protein
MTSISLPRRPGATRSDLTFVSLWYAIGGEYRTHDDEWQMTPSDPPARRSSAPSRSPVGRVPAIVKREASCNHGAAGAETELTGEEVSMPCASRTRHRHDGLGCLITRAVSPIPRFGAEPIPIGIVMRWPGELVPVPA